jgi:NAD(P)-dependent dehydrogenase (short-subunit alcohol dehydrogenase family)
MPISDVSDRSLPELLSLEGRVAVVTGGAVGIGYSIAERFAEAGADVVIGDIGDAVSAAVRISQRFPSRRIVGTTLDVGDSKSIRACADLAVRELGRLDVWVNNAGIYPSVPVLNMTDDDWDRVLDVNLRGAFVGAREAAQRMVTAERGGVIINIASTAGYQAGGPGVAHYVSSKHGMRGLTKSLAVELGPVGIRVLAIAPTLIETPGIEAGREQFRRAGLGNLLDTYADRLPLRRTGVPDDVARVAVFCASDLATFMTGSTVLADGGDVAV